ncbi:MAG: TonB family protein [Myxococcota bacterium]|nr:TonB family protein [Myxococcota bacterium]
MIIFVALLNLASVAAGPPLNDGRRSNEAEQEAGVPSTAAGATNGPTSPVPQDDGAANDAGSNSEPGSAPDLESPSTGGPSEADDDGADNSAIPRGESTSAPRLVFAPALNYPPEPLANGVSGTVLLQIDVAADGTVSAVRAVDYDRDDFAAEAVANARSFRFEPVIGPDGLPAAFQLQYRTVFEATQAAQVSVEGRVREAGPRRVLANADIVAVGPDDQRVLAATDAEGRFRFSGLPEGTWTIGVSAAGHVPEAFSVAVKLGTVRRVDAFLVRDEVRTGQSADEELIVTALAPRSEITERTLTAEDVRYLPGTGGDVVKVIQNLPGIARPPLGTGNLRIRGTAPEDSLYFLDGGRIPIVFHFSGLTTVLSSDLLSEVAFLPGSYSVRYGRALGGLVDLRTTPSLPERSNGNASVDVFQAAVFAEQRVGERDSLTVSTRRSYADAVLNPILNNGTLTVQAPRYYDGQLRWSRKLDNGWNDVLVLASDDRFRFLGQGEDETVIAGFATQFQKLRWLHTRDMGNGRTFEASLVTGPERQFFENDNTSEAFEREFRVSTRVQIGQELGLDRSLGWMVGTDPNFNRSSFLYDIARPPERTVSNNRVAPTESGDANIWQPSLYGELALRRGDWTLYPGVRTDLQLLDSTRVWSIDPRLRSLWSIGDGTVITTGAGVHSQAPTARQLGVESDGNPDLQAEKAYQFSLGVEQFIASWFTLDLTGFYHLLDDLVVGREDRFAFYSGPPPTGPFDTDPYANEGTGRTFGIELLGTISATNTSGFIAATVSRSDRVNRPGDERTLFAYDQPLVVNALVSRKLPKRWRLGARVRYGSGNPYTPVTNRVYNHDRREFIPVYGERDSARLPPFFSLDVRIDKDYVFKRWTLTTYLDIQNATYAKNVETQGYSYDYTDEEPILSNPPLPAFGLRGEW